MSLKKVAQTLKTSSDMSSDIFYFFILLLFMFTYIIYFTVIYVYVYSAKARNSQWWIVPALNETFLPFYTRS